MKPQAIIAIALTYGSRCFRIEVPQTASVVQLRSLVRSLFKSIRFPGFGSTTSGRASASCAARPHRTLVTTSPFCQLDATQAPGSLVSGEASTVHVNGSALNAALSVCHDAKPSQKWPNTKNQAVKPSGGVPRWTDRIARIKKKQQKLIFLSLQTVRLLRTPMETWAHVRPLM